MEFFVVANTLMEPVLYNSMGTTVVVCIDLSGKEAHNQVGVGRVMTLEESMWLNCYCTGLEC